MAVQHGGQTQWQSIEINIIQNNLVQTKMIPHLDVSELHVGMLIALFSRDFSFPLKGWDLLRLKLMCFGSSRRCICSRCERSR